MEDFLKNFGKDCLLGIILLSGSFLLSVLIKGLAVFALATMHLTVGQMAMVYAILIAIFVIITFAFNFIVFIIKTIYKLCKKLF